MTAAEIVNSVRILHGDLAADRLAAIHAAQVEQTGGAR